MDGPEVPTAQWVEDDEDYLYIMVEGYDSAYKERINDRLKNCYNYVVAGEGMKFTVPNVRLCPWCNAENILKGTFQHCKHANCYNCNREFCYSCLGKKEPGGAWPCGWTPFQPCPTGVAKRQQLL
ncbi:hypothetical protein Pelo_6037 [Pelomyxa schiedti]|nr:hypothetical protein Pelo_6037 [Pelomyxa schiedti]